jgi:hypothetical protein
MYSLYTVSRYYSITKKFVMVKMKKKPAKAVSQLTDVL